MPEAGARFRQNLSEIALAMGKAVPTCDCCLLEKPDAQVRAGFYPRDAQGKESEKAFLGFLCDECLAHVRRPGSAENRWLLKQVGL
jgi:hypothetical protein